MIIADYQLVAFTTGILRHQGWIMAYYQWLCHLSGRHVNIVFLEVIIVYRKKLLYIMGIDWQWILQRPQVIGLHLENNYDVTVVFPRSILKWQLVLKGEYPRCFGVLWTLPFQEKNIVLNFLSCLLARPLFRHIEQYDAIVIGYPLYYRYIPTNYCGKVIYDCMDNYETLYPYKKGVTHVLTQEKKLVQRCDALVVSCQKLYWKMAEYANVKSTVTRVIRNGTNINTIIEPHSATKQDGKYRIGYFGTLAEWFDYPLLEKSLSMNKDLEYHLIGPYIGGTPQKHSGLIYEGIVPHNQLAQRTKSYACLIMPFFVNDIVEWVDPVKLYEYIALGKCIVSVYYDEIERFSDYVYFYRTEDEYIELMELLKRESFTPKYTIEQQKEFLYNNSWDVRLKEWDELLHLLGL